MPRMKIFLDSGAFSAYAKNLTIDVYDYIDFIKKNAHLIEAYASLDVIGCAGKSKKNFEIMRAEGLDPLPVYHVGEPFSYLKDYVEECSYIALGGSAGKFTGDPLRRELDRIWSENLLTDEGKPKVKVHGFGITSVPLMIRYPWYSVDSTSWLKLAAYGKIYIPIFKADGTPDYTKIPHTLITSDDSPTKVVKGKHFYSYPDSVKKKILEYLDSKGLDMEKLKGHYKYRLHANIQYFLDFQASLKPLDSYNHLRKKEGFFQ